MGRKEAREEAFILLFEYSFHNEKMIDIINKTQEYRKELEDFTKTTAINVEKNLVEIDEIISKNSSSWNINRISKMALATLRVAVYEIVFDEEMPVSVAINEAVEIIKKYGKDGEFAFVNGVLGSVSDDMENKKGDL